MSKAELNEILQSYWPSLRKFNNEEYSAATLLNHRQLICMWLKDELSVDIIYDSDFTVSNNVFKNYLKSLKIIIIILTYNFVSVIF